MKIAVCIATVGLLCSACTGGPAAEPTESSKEHRLPGVSDTDPRLVIPPIRMESGVFNAIFSPDGNKFLVAGRTRGLPDSWVKERLEDHVEKQNVNPNTASEFLDSITPNVGLVRLFDASTGDEPIPPIRQNLFSIQVSVETGPRF